MITSVNEVMKLSLHDMFFLVLPSIKYPLFKLFSLYVACLYYIKHAFIIYSMSLLCIACLYYIKHVFIMYSMSLLCIACLYYLRPVLSL